ncbi:DUF5618 family protein [Siphonobacter aquaeclarae]|uniref:DUF5618 domain-containing protein n=1 Tax=Siphonobacter aquaeclarae TaxID=563176 RepID=A0A1G9S4J8_9BACT|nr:DUF5618 family protein [Siphonobacter aquaeclarae]SDM30210.1 hypothetical protein SAMN04488090_3169 [Siphonobacter aquaeclarae]
MKAVTEARRYLENARALLRDKAIKEEGYYQDIKYVRMAGHTAYSGVLVALDAALGVKKKGRKSVEWYKEELAALDKKALGTFVSAYDILHLSMGYDGVPSAKIANYGLEEADTLINWVELRLA